MNDTPKRYTWKDWREANEEYKLCYDSFKANEPYIDDLEALLKEACAVIEFYGDESNWDGLGSCKFTKDDLEDYVSEEYHDEVGETEYILEDQRCGKRARKFLQENKEAISEVRGD